MALSVNSRRPGKFNAATVALRPADNPGDKKRPDSGESGLLPLNVTGGSVAAAIPAGAVLKEAAREAAH